MTFYQWLILALWIAFYALWAVLAVGAKKSVRPRGWWRKQVALRAGVFIVVLVVVVALHRPLLRPVLRFLKAHAGDALPALAPAGVVLCLLGFGLALWARIHMGRNWGVPMSRKAEPELVTGGPYARVRHPIYTGMLVAILGTAIGESALWLIPLLMAAGFLVYSAYAEEKLMLEQFPEQYAAYRRRTKMLVPFLL